MVTTDRWHIDWFKATTAGLIHDSKIVPAALWCWGDRIRLPFLPASCPNDTKSERMWQDLHANVLRNHTCRTITALRGRFATTSESDTERCSE